MMDPLSNRPLTVFLGISVLLHLCLAAMLGYIGHTPVVTQPAPLRMFVQTPAEDKPVQADAGLLQPDQSLEPVDPFKEKSVPETEDTSVKPVREKPVAEAAERIVQTRDAEKRPEVHEKPAPPAKPVDLSETEQASDRPEEPVKTAKHAPASIAAPVVGKPAEESLDDFLNRIVSQIEKAKNYPMIARRRGMQGEVVCRFIITRDGRLKEAVVLSASPYTVLDRAAIDAIKRAAPYPAFPEFYREESLTSSVTIRFELN